MKRVSEALDLLDGILRESEAEDRPQGRVKITFPLETVMTLTKATEATSDKVTSNANIGFIEVAYFLVLEIIPFVFSLVFLEVKSLLLYFIHLFKLCTENYEALMAQCFELFHGRSCFLCTPMLFL